jgi:hypothetical protein
LALFGRRPSERGDSLGMPASENLHRSSRQSPLISHHALAGIARGDVGELAAKATVAMPKMTAAARAILVKISKSSLPKPAWRATVGGPAADRSIVGHVGGRHAKNLAREGPRLLISAARFTS